VLSPPLLPRLRGLPWLGLLRSGIVDQPLHILDQCRTTPALVESVDAEDTLTVSARPLLWEDGMLVLGAAAPRTVRWRTDDLAFITEPAPGDLVSLHWDYVCDQLSPRSARALLAQTSVRSWLSTRLVRRRKSCPRSAAELAKSSTSRCAIYSRL